jgi:hypothetical protein
VVLHVRVRVVSMIRVDRGPETVVAPSCVRMHGALPQLPPALNRAAARRDRQNLVASGLQVSMPDTAHIDASLFTH